MQPLSDRLFEAFREKASGTRVDFLSVGLGYTAVISSDGGLGMAYTALDAKQGCSVVPKEMELEGAPCIELLEHLRSPVPLYRSMALALVNALNHADAADLPEDRDNRLLFDVLEIGASTRVAMVGYFAPLIPKLRERGADVEVVDVERGLGDPSVFQKKLQDWAQVVILTSTAILNDTIDPLLDQIGPAAKAAMLGPSTPLVAAPFANTAIKILAGTVPMERDSILKAIRHGKGTPALQRFSRKPYLLI